MSGPHVAPESRVPPVVDLQGGLFAYGVMILVVSLSLALVRIGLEAGAEPSLELGMLAQAAGLVAVLVFACWWRRGFSVVSRGSHGVGSAVLWYAGFLVVWVPLCLFGIPWLWRALGWEIAPQPHLAYFSEPDFASLGFWGMLVTICVLGPIGEEVIFRGFLYTGMRGIAGRTRALWTTSLLFGLVHVASGWHLLIPLTMVGWLFGVVRERSDGLAAPIACHVLHNTLTVAITMFLPDILDWVYK